MFSDDITEPAKWPDGLIRAYGEPAESFDSVRIAGVWLASQQLIQKTRHCGALKHVIESSGGRYVAESDVVIAAEILGLKGRYPRYNIGRPFIKPLQSAYAGIEEAGIHPSYYGRLEEWLIYRNVTR